MDVSDFNPNNQRLELVGAQIKSESFMQNHAKMDGRIDRTARYNTECTTAPPNLHLEYIL